MTERRSHAILALTILAGLFLLGYYTRYLFRQDLKVWDEVQVQFADVGGLKQNSEVQVEGQTLGRVKQVDLYQDRQVAVLQLEPGIDLHQDYAITIVPKNAIGQMVVRITRGSPDQPKVIPGALLEGELFEGLGAGDSTPQRQREVSDMLHELASTTRLVQDPEAGGIGQLLFNRERKERLALALDDLEGSWSRIDEGLAELDAGEEGPGALTVSGETLLVFQETLHTLRTTFGDAQRSLSAADRGEGSAGRMLADPAFARTLEESLARQAAFFRATRRGEGFLGELDRPELHETVLHSVTALRDRTEEAEDDRGLLGVLSSPTYDEHVRKGLDRIADATRDFNNSPLLRSPLVRDALQDGGGDLHDLVIEMERAVRFIDRTLPARRSFQGAVFAIF
jgi:hypothetical protein